MPCPLDDFRKENYETQRVAKRNGGHISKPNSNVVCIREKSYAWKT